MQNKNLVNKIVLGDCLAIMSKMEENSIDLVLTDPPYFLDKLDNNWKHAVAGNKKNQQIIKSLPAGMKFSRTQGLKFYDWYLKVAKEVFRILKPGGFFFSFSSPRLYHRLASAVDDAGFLIRDCFLWIYTQNQAKAMSLDHFVDKMKIKKQDKDNLKLKLKGWKTPQIKSCFEPIIMAQKPTEGTFIENMLKHNIGLFNTNVRVGENMYPSNIFTIDNINDVMDKHFLISKPSKNEKGDFNIHMTVKPLELCEHIIRLSTISNSAVILDPFLGSGTTAVAARRLNRNYIGIDINPEYIEVARKRLKQIQSSMFNA